MRTSFLQLTLPLMLLVGLQARAQRIPKEEMTVKLYFEKHDRQKAAAWSMAGGGAALVALGAIIGIGKREVKDSADVLRGLDPGTKAGTWVAAAGGAAMLGSIPLFVAARKNKQRGMQMGFLPQFVPSDYGQRRFRGAVVLAVPVGR